MPTNFQIDCDLDFPAELFWPLRATETFLDFLIRDGCLSHMESNPATVLHPTTPHLRLRKQTYAPTKMDIPDFIQVLLPTKLILVNDTQHWDERQQDFKQNFECKPTVLSDFVTTGGSLSLRPKVEGVCCTHTIEGDTVVNMPYFGYYIEQAIVKNLELFYRGYPQHVSNFKGFLVERFGDGDVRSLENAVQSVLEREGENEVDTKFNNE